MSKAGNDHVLLETITECTMGEPDTVMERWLDPSNGSETVTHTRAGVVVSQSTVAPTLWSDTIPPQTANEVSGSSYATGVTTQWPLVQPDIPEALKPLMELIGKCVACGDEADVLLCTSCGVAVRQTGRDKLQKAMEDMEEELG